jgi:TATA-binding protein-associated factor Taf7
MSQPAKEDPFTGREDGYTAATASSSSSSSGVDGHREYGEQPEGGEERERAAAAAAAADHDDDDQQHTHGEDGDADGETQRSAVRSRLAQTDAVLEPTVFLSMRHFLTHGGTPPVLYFVLPLS